MANDITVHQSSMAAFIERAVLDSSFDVAKLDALLRMQREELQQLARRAFNRAMSAAQAEMGPVVRDKVNTHTNSRYARLETIDREMRPIYTRHGFSVRYGSAQPPQDGWIRITCTVAHIEGYFEEHYLDAQIDSVGARGSTNKTQMQAVGSSVTYLRRYLLTMVFNVVLADDEEDNDGERRPAQVSRPAAAPPRQPEQPAGPLDEPNGTRWLKNLQGLLDATQSLDEIAALGGHPSVRNVLGPNSKAPSTIRALIEEDFRRAADRLAPKPEPQSDPEWPDDPIAPFVAEIEDMDLITLSNIDDHPTWRARLRALEFPPDRERIADVIEARRIALQTTEATS